MYLIVGLGNPGKQYFATRHNIGFSAMDYLSQKHNIAITKIKHKGLIGEGSINGERVLLLKPQTFMNLSGESVRDAATFYKIPSENIMIIYDDVSLPVGKIRLREKGSAGGHNGIKSIIAHLGTDVFPRVKIGVGSPKPETDLADHVLGRISKEEEKILFEMLEKTNGAVETFVKQGMERAMNQYSG